MCRVSRSVAFTARLRIAAGESLLALPMGVNVVAAAPTAEMKAPTADSAAKEGRHSRNGGLSPLCQFARGPPRFGVVGTATDRTPNSRLFVPTFRVRTRRAEASHQPAYFTLERSAYQQESTVGLGNGRRVGRGGGCLIASRLQMVCAA